MKNKPKTESTSHERRQALAADVEKFLQAGNKIQHIGNGISAQDPQGKGRPLHLGQSKESKETNTTK